MPCSLAKKRLRETRLSNHRSQSFRPNVVVGIVVGNGHHSHLTIHDTAIMAMARSVVPMQDETVRLDDRDELTESTF